MNSQCDVNFKNVRSTEVKLWSLTLRGTTAAAIEREREKEKEREREREREKRSWKELRCLCQSRTRLL